MTMRSRHQAVYVISVAAELAGMRTNCSTLDLKVNSVVSETKTLML